MPWSGERQVGGGFGSIRTGGEPRTGGRPGVSSPRGEETSLAGRAVQGRTHLTCCPGFCAARAMRLRAARVESLVRHREAF